MANFFDLFKRNATPENAKTAESSMTVLRQFQSSLTSEFEVVSKLGNLSEPEKQVAATLKASLDKDVFAEKLEERFDWKEAYHAQRLLASLCPRAAIDSKIDAQLEQLRRLDEKQYTASKARQAVLEKDRPDPKAAKDEAAETAFLSELRWFLDHLLEENHWKYNRRFSDRKNIERYIRRICWFSIGVASLFLVSIALSAATIKFDWWYFPGLMIAIFAGMIGSSLSVLTSAPPLGADQTVEDVQSKTSMESILLRFGVGAVAALIIYFIFESGFIEGPLVPDLNQIGFQAVVPPAGLTISFEALKLTLSDALLVTSVDGLSAELVQALEPLAEREKLAELLAQTGLDAGGATVSQAQQWRDAMTGIAAELAEGDLKTVLSDESQVAMLGDHLADKLSEDPDQPSDVWRALREMVPNADLSKLIVWSFAAGFSEKMVQNVLGRAESATANTK